MKKIFIFLFSSIFLLFSSSSFAYRPLFEWTAANTIDSREISGTFVRASSAYETNINTGLLTSVASNTARFELVGGKIAYRCGPESTNSLIYSEELDRVSWTKTRASVSANAVDAPDGSTTADKIVEDSTPNSSHLVFKYVDHATFTDDVTHTFSGYVKQGERTWLKVSVYNKAAVWITAYYDLANGTVGTVSANGTARIESAPNGFYRCSLSFDIENGAQNCGFYFSPAVADNDNQYDGDGSSGIYVWGAQVEELLCASSYIKTTDAAAPRATESGYPEWTLSSALTSLFAETLGSDELGGNGDCATDFFDSKSAGWTHDIGNGEYDCDGSQLGVADLTENNVATVDSTYKITWTVKNYVVGAIRVQIGTIGTGGIGPWISADGTYNHYVKASTVDFVIRGNVDFIGSVDDIVVKEVTNASSNGGPPEGTVIIRFAPDGWDYDDVPTGTTINGIVSVRSISRYSLMWAHYSDAGGGRIIGKDGTLEPWAQVNWTDGVWCKLFNKFGYLVDNVSKFLIAYDKGAGYTEGTEKDYDGAFVVDTKIRIGDSVAYPMHIRDLRIYDQVPTDYAKVASTDEEINYQLYESSDSTFQLNGIHVPAGETGVKIQNCTIVDFECLGILAEETCTVTNTICDDNDESISIAAGKTVTGTYNCMESSAKQGDGTYSDGSSTTLWSTDPTFIDLAAGNFKLRADSPCINAGTDLGLTQDFRGRSVPKNNVPDIGAYESIKSLQLPHFDTLTPVYAP